MARKLTAKFLRIEQIKLASIAPKKTCEAQRDFGQVAEIAHDVFGWGATPFDVEMKFKVAYDNNLISKSGQTSSDYAVVVETFNKGLVYLFKAPEVER